MRTYGGGCTAKAKAKARNKAFSLTVLPADEMRELTRVLYRFGNRYLSPRDKSTDLELWTIGSLCMWLQVNTLWVLHGERGLLYWLGGHEQQLCDDLTMVFGDYIIESTQLHSLMGPWERVVWLDLNGPAAVTEGVQ